MNLALQLPLPAMRVSHLYATGEKRQVDRARPYSVAVRDLSQGPPPLVELSGFGYLLRGEPLPPHLHALTM